MRDPGDPKCFHHRRKKISIFEPGLSTKEILNNALPGTQTIVLHAASEAHVR